MKFHQIYTREEVYKRKPDPFQDQYERDDIQQEWIGFQMAWEYQQKRFDQIEPLFIPLPDPPLPPPPPPQRHVGLDKRDQLKTNNFTDKQVKAINRMGWLLFSVGMAIGVAIAQLIFVFVSV